jgi:Transcription elongation factor, GreA/GreB, C-term
MRRAMPGALPDLVRALGSLEIDPMGVGETSTVWTEFRTIATTTTSEIEEIVLAPDAIMTPAPAIVTKPPEENGGASVEIGDRVQVQVGEDTRVRVLTLTADRHDPDVGIISVRHPAGAALLGAQEDEEVEFEIDNNPRQWMVIKIEKGQAFASV